MPQCRTAAEVASQQLVALQAAGGLPLLHLAGWLLQAVLASCGALVLAAKALDALRWVAAQHPGLPSSKLARHVPGVRVASPIAHPVDACHVQGKEACGKR